MMKICGYNNKVFFKGLLISSGVDVKIKVGKTKKWFSVSSGVDDYNLFKIWDKENQKIEEISTLEIVDIRVQK